MNADPIVWLLALCVILRVFCGWTTYQGLKHGLIESVDITERAIVRYGKYWGLVLVNAVSITAFAFIAWFPPLDPDYKMALLFLLAAYYASIAHNNWTNLKDARR